MSNCCTIPYQFCCMGISGRGKILIHPNRFLHCCEDNLHGAVYDCIWDHFNADLSHQEEFYFELPEEFINEWKKLKNYEGSNY